MRKYCHFILILGVIVVASITMNSCREEFDSAFREVPIINQPPMVTTPIDDVVISPGFDVLDIDLSGFIQDPENDPITYQVSSSDEDVVTVSVVGSLLSIYEIEPGTSNISILGNDGNDGNDVNTSFMITIR